MIPKNEYTSYRNPGRLLVVVVVSTDELYIGLFMVLLYIFIYSCQLNLIWKH